MGRLGLGLGLVLRLGLGLALGLQLGIGIGFRRNHSWSSTFTPRRNHSLCQSNIIFHKLCSTLSIDNKHSYFYLALKLRLAVNVVTSFCL